MDNYHQAPDYQSFQEGTHYRSYQFMGAHPRWEDGMEGVRFTVWAPNARRVNLVSDFNGWNGNSHSLAKINDSGLWTIFIGGMREGALYQYEIVTAQGQYIRKSDPYAFGAEFRPATASIVRYLHGYSWNDHGWTAQKSLPFQKPINIYEVHLGSWRRRSDGTFLSYAELADQLIEYAANLGYTHLELLPVTEHPYDSSWGYQSTGYYAPTSRHGTSKDFMNFVNRCHERGLGVILDWVPGHFCKDDHGLRLFDGTPIFEYNNPSLAETDWNTLCFDLGKPQVQSFLISNALYWMDIYHIDGIRVDSVTDMLTPSRNGRRENPEAAKFLRKLNTIVFKEYPNTLMIAEDAGFWPMVTLPVYAGGLGFNFKWNMSWMFDTLNNIQHHPHNENQKRQVSGAYDENYVLPLSHDEVVHGKKSLLGKMHGGYDEKFKRLRLFLGYMYTFPGKKLMFMGAEFGQYEDWKDSAGLDWHLLHNERHQRIQHYVRELNQLYLREPALWELDHDRTGFCWIKHWDDQNHVISFIRKSTRDADQLIIICNLGNSAQQAYRVGTPYEGSYELILNSNHSTFGGNGHGSSSHAIVTAISTPCYNQPCSATLELSPYSILILKKRS
jgi:1,4-alpha-glucan branching enzyme